MSTEESGDLSLTPATQASSTVAAMDGLEGVEGLYASENFLEEDKGIAVECDSYPDEDDVSSIASSSCEEDLDDADDDDLLGLEQELMDLELDLLESYDGKQERGAYSLEKESTVPRRRRLRTSLLGALASGTEEEFLDTDSYRLARKRGIPVWKGRPHEFKHSEQGLSVPLLVEISTTIVVPLGTSGSEMAEYFSGQKRLSEI
eukprot:Nitzschia sp. Nitz4//scaffold340_size24592//4686//5297//NITZ4_008360-RA/size24592-processed-gene-0.10-mRNA-1//-1//CDS//3329548512//8132//frame0